MSHTTAMYLAVVLIAAIPLTLAVFLRAVGRCHPPARRQHRHFGIPEYRDGGIIIPRNRNSYE